MKVGGWRRWFILLFSSALLLAGCASVRKPVTQPGTATPAGGKGGYYQDDGPGDSSPANLEATPDAVPRNETAHRFANRPYEVLGSQYVPEVLDKPYRQQGVASWYGRKFHGKRTAIGEPYDMYGMTAAHRTLPIPSYVRVTNLRNNRTVLLRVNDRGPFHADRLIDLSYTAALKLGLLGGGSGRVEVERVFAQDGPPASLAAGHEPLPQPTAAAAATVSEPAQAPSLSPNATGIYLQLGAFGSLSGAQVFRNKVKSDLAWPSAALQILARDGLYRVRLGPYATHEEAMVIADKIREKLDFKPYVATQ